MDTGLDDEEAQEVCIGLEQEYEAITMLAAAHLLHDRSAPPRSSVDSGCRMCQACELKCKQALQSQLPKREDVVEGDEVGPDSGGVLPEQIRQHTARFFDALRKVSAIQAQSLAAKDKVVELGRSFRAECERAKELESRLEAMTTDRDRLLQEKEQGQHTTAKARLEREDMHKSLLQERCQAAGLQERLDALTAEHDELMARDMLQSHVLRSLRSTEHQLAQARAERDCLASSLAQERTGAQHLRAQLEQRALEAAERDRLALSLKHERDGKRKLCERLERLTAEHDEELVQEFLCQSAHQGREAIQPCRAA